MAETQWQYLDFEGAVQGPYPETTMKVWFQQGYFAPNIKVKSQNEDEFVEISIRKPPFTVKEEGDKPKVQTPVTPTTSTPTAQDDGRKAENSHVEAKPQNGLDDTNGSKDLKDSKISDNIEIRSFEEDGDTPMTEEIAQEASQSSESKPEEPTKIEERIVPEKPTKAEEKAEEIISAASMGPPPSKRGLHWLYIDDEGRIQGPFENTMMMQWYKGGGFRDIIRIQHYHMPKDGIPDPRNIDPKRYVKIKEYKDCEFIVGEKKKDYKSLKWFFVDDRERVRGPYTSAVMCKWVDSGYLPKTTKVKERDENRFISIVDRDEPFGVDNDKEEATWWYVDDTGKEQGPYTLSLMSYWYDKGYIPDSIRCRQLGEMQLSFVRQKRQLFTKIEEPEMQVDPQAVSNEEIQWYYIDLDNRKEQGPFTNDAMRSWYLAGYIPPTTKVRKKAEQAWIAIKDRPFCDFLPASSTPVIQPSANITPSVPQVVSKQPNEPGFTQTKERVPLEKSQSTAEKEPDWYYIGDELKEKGPFTSDLMRSWWTAGYFTLDIRVRQANEGVHRFAPIRTRDCCFTRPKFAQIQKPQNLAQAAMSMSRLNSTLDEIDNSERK